VAREISEYSEFAAACGLLGVEPEEITRQNITDYFPKGRPDWEKYNRFLQAYRAEKKKYRAFVEIGKVVREKIRQPDQLTGRGMSDWQAAPAFRGTCFV
jgi:hypothetical protein